MARILVVDDSITDRRLIAGALEKHTVIEATNGDEAIAKVGQTKPDLIIMDVVMPGKNGFQTVREIRRIPGASELPIIMLTTKNQPTDKEWSLRQGATEYLTKPFRDDDLQKIVDHYLRSP